MSYVVIPRAEECVMGSIFTDVTVANKVDVNLEEAGSAARETVRRIHLKDVLVDTGATTLSLPRSLIVQLGLPLKRRIRVQTAAGETETELYEQAEVTVEGQTGTVECVALPEGAPPLLGVIPLEMLGLQPDLTRHILRVLPNDTRDTYFHV